VKVSQQPSLYICGPCASPPSSLVSLVLHFQIFSRIPSRGVTMRFRTVATQLALLASWPLAASQDSISYDFDSYGNGDSSGTPYQTYMSNTNVKPPQMQINRNGTALMDGYVFVGVDGEPTSGQNWPAIFGKAPEDQVHGHVV
jgi:hypothetical protein